MRYVHQLFHAPLLLPLIAFCLSDDVVSTRNFDHDFTIITAMPKNSVISKGVSPIAKDSVKHTISAMLRLLPSNYFSITVSKHPLHHLLFFFITIGYQQHSSQIDLLLPMSCVFPFA
ncbi:hypothetical protein VNO78_14948 [Psophocarpus tetragonolobus]|uniref:Secreted protein n=1 Tax=Psophocarpus tetragonolobus TaxID=3891 RepID=A0AAN9SFJ1_PSOTE